MYFLTTMNRSCGLTERTFEHLPAAIKQFYEDFAIIKGDKYGSPRHFDALTTSWYLNHSIHPNVASDKQYRFYALRDIEAGEELTADYRTYSDLPTRSDSDDHYMRDARARTSFNRKDRSYRQRVSR